ncbi:MAG: hypothetical protein MUP08_02625 [Desulfobulbaceae bacterium]|nr:hypothetical protein [Desulfobulbaceae bacterium]
MDLLVKDKHPFSLDEHGYYFLYSPAKTVSVHRFRVQRSGSGIRTKLKSRSPRKKCWFCHIIAKYHVPDPPASPVMYGTGISQEVGNGGQVCGDV